jgi:hypothetical protein
VAGTLAVSSTAHAAGLFGPARTTGINHPAALAVGDFDDNGRPDLAVVSDFGKRVDILRRDGSGRFQPDLSVFVGNMPETIAVGDWNNDGHDDLAVGNSDDSDVSIRLGTGHASFTAAPDVPAGRSPQSLVAGDFNADGRDDLAVAGGPNAQSFTAGIFLGAGNGTFSKTGDVAPGAASLAVADVDGDAREDLLYGSVITAFGRLVLGTGGGAFGAPSDLPVPNYATYRRSWAVGDFDADGRADFAAGLDHAAVSVRLGDGTGAFPRGRDVPVPGRPAAVTIGDVDDDGHEDLVAAEAAPQGAVRIRLGDGAGGFRAAPDLPAGAFLRDAALADFDGDGRDDLVLANTESNNIIVHYGTGPRALAGNLPVNGGFEHLGKPLYGWEVRGLMIGFRYGAQSTALIPSWSAAPRLGTGGGRLLSGGDSAGTDGVTSATQSVDVRGSATAIDAGQATASLSAYLGGALRYADAMTARAEFLDSAGAIRGSFVVGPVTPADRHNQTTLMRRAKQKAVPVGTRAIRVTVRSDDADSSFSSALADNVKLRLSSTSAARQGTTRTRGLSERLRSAHRRATRPETASRPGTAFRVTGGKEAP